MREQDAEEKSGSCEQLTNQHYSLATVNFFLAIVGVVQVGRILNYNYTQKGESAGDQLVEAKESIVETGKKIEKKIENAVKS